MNAPVPVEARFGIFAQPETQAIATLIDSCFPGAKPESVRMVMAWCRAKGKDPLLKPVHIVPMNVKDAASGQSYWRDTIMLGIANYRQDARATGEYAGMDEATFGPDVSENLGGTEITYPEWCSVTVYRLVQGQRCPFPSGKVRWKETYATRGGKERSLAPNAMWAKRPYGQLEKCAEAQALRRAFPDQFGGTNTVEEMEGRVVDSQMIDAATGEIVAPAATPSAPPPSRLEAVKELLRPAGVIEGTAVVEADPPAAPTTDEATARFAEIQDRRELAAYMNRLPQAVRGSMAKAFSARIAALKDTA